MPKKNCLFEIKNKKRLQVSIKTDELRRKKKGRLYLFVKVKDSDKNQCRIKIVVKEEPWIVSEKDKKYDYAEMTGDLRKIAHKYPEKQGCRALAGHMTTGKSGACVWKSFCGKETFL